MPLLTPLNPPLPAWPDARVWIIGASTGIGAATAQSLLAEDARVALSARQADKLREVAAGHSRALVEALDFTRGAEIVAAWGGYNHVLGVAGTIPRSAPGI